VDEDQNGFLVDESQLSGFSSALWQLLTQRGDLQRFREASLRKAVHFDINRIVEQYENIFDDIFSRF
jgi:glycosyltransferase involved in cell wall biosynthesis